MADTDHANLIKNLQAKARRLQDKLSPNQAIFADLWIKTRNATKSYLDSYPSCKTINAAAVNGAKALRNAKIKAYIDCRLEIMQQKTLIVPENLLREESKIIFRDIRRLFDGESLISPDQLPDEIAAIVEAVEIKSRRVKDGDDWTTEYTYKYKLADKGAALGRMERHLAMYVDKQEITGPGGGAIQVEDMSQNEIARRIAFALYTGMQNMEKQDVKP